MNKHFTLSKGTYHGYLIAVDESGNVLNSARVFTDRKKFKRYLAARYPGATFTDK